ncbi:MAG: methionyl-tRNA formyltransferase [bacterium]
MEPLKIVYFGTPDFSADFIKKIISDKKTNIEIIGVVTQIDKKVGRKQILTTSPVKKLALNNFLKVFYNFKSKDFISQAIKSDLGLVFSYGKIIPSDVLKLFKYGVWVIHPSILPKYKGASPIAYSLINGDEKTGVTFIIADEGIDTGDIIGQEEINIKSDEKRNELTNRLVEVAYFLFKKCISTFVNNNYKIFSEKQIIGQYPVTKKLVKEQGFVTPAALNLAMKKNGKKTYNLYRGLYPWPGIWTMVKVKGQEKRLKITEMKLDENKIVLKKVQLEGKKEVDFSIFNSAYNIFI